MSEDFSSYNNAKSSNVVNPIICYNNSNNIVKNNTELNSSYDHMYASNTENGENDAVDRKQTCQSAESEVKFLKDWLLFHLDLIQQQNDEILSKEKQILILQHENDILKEKINCMEQGAPYMPESESNVTPKIEHVVEEPKHDLTLNLPLEDNKETIELLPVENPSDLISSNDQESDNLGPSVTKDEVLHEQESQSDNLDLNVTDIGLNINEIYAENSDTTEQTFKTELTQEPEQVVEKNDTQTKSEVSFNPNISAEFDVTLNNSDFDPMRSLRMSIRRKRVCSNSSALSANGSASGEKKPFRKQRKRRRRSLKDSQSLTCAEPYSTQIGDFGELHEAEPIPQATTATNLEVPRWRVKVYASCYTMEGTENLDDDVYNRRHMRLENDERRRKRWDFQRIREQRVIEKLKQRQERVGSGSKCEGPIDPLKSFWPTLDDIKFIEVCDELPVSAFGCPIPKVSSSDFTIPWLNNTTPIVTKKLPAKKSSSKRKKSKR